MVVWCCRLAEGPLTVMHVCTGTCVCVCVSGHAVQYPQTHMKVRSKSFGNK
jgi:hypothetical protein